MKNLLIAVFTLTLIACGGEDGSQLEPKERHVTYIESEAHTSGCDGKDYNTVIIFGNHPESDDQHWNDFIIQVCKGDLPGLNLIDYQVNMCTNPRIDIIDMDIDGTLQSGTVTYCEKHGTE